MEQTFKAGWQYGRSSVDSTDEDDYLHWLSGATPRSIEERDSIEELQRKVKLYESILFSIANPHLALMESDLSIDVLIQTSKLSNSVTELRRWASAYRSEYTPEQSLMMLKASHTMYEAYVNSSDTELREMGVGRDYLLRVAREYSSVYDKIEQHIQDNKGE